MITIPETDLVVHELCLGTNVFGWSADEAESHAVLDAYRSHGGNFVDTADMYSAWKEGNVGGESETIIGNWMAKKGNRDQMVVATKVAKLPTRPGLHPDNIIAACNDSLKRLQSDHIDIYYAHHDDPTIPLEDVLGAFAQLIAEGKVRYIAASQYTGARLQEALDVSAKHNLPSYIALQDQYNLVSRNPFESEQQPVLAAHGISAIPFYGLARGFLSGKYREGKVVESVRAEGVKEFATPKGYATLAVMDQIAEAHNCSVSAVSLAWLRSNPQLSTPIASARTVEQLEEIVQVVDLAPDEVLALNAVSAPTT
jgi:aryl-alcohol dehydrogenase-like predicted oxidoreductase